ncbi:GPI-anchored protein LLG1-like [Nicotiana sylvestris]|uniref:GPI-anchored protein LORELEI-like n=1 Tax=Nicotiana sylvestris TaxID=4096 RepID=A0A1U7Y602_NICSY|nr:PREDICTED: GPI-anchored protein LORELEI-like [Nicotiana sylvestris]
MGFKKCFFLFLFFLLVGLASPSPFYIKNDVLEARVQTGRALLQQQGNCPVDFEKENYTIVTSQCKGPHYNETLCCNAFKQLACNHMDEINDVQNGCATIMFNYINLYGKYPPGLFANMCKEDKKGLNCDNITPPEGNKPEEQKSNSAKGSKSSMVLVLIASILIILFNI